MLLEALNFAATYTISPRREAGEINSSIALWARARRCARQWAEHERNCKDFVLKSIGKMPRRRAVAVLGSGLLRDVPIEALSRSFDTVRLYDLQHLASVRAWAKMRGLDNLRFENRDLSGLSDIAGGKTPQPLAFLKAIADLDLVISANIMSQIGVGIGRLVEKDDTLPKDTVPRLLRAHVEGLSSLPVTTCLLTDTSYVVTDKAGKVVESADLTHGIPLPAAEAEWSWPVAPFGEIGPDHQAIHSVMASIARGDGAA